MLRKISLLLSPFLSKYLPLLLILSLLCSQWSGLQHRVAHASFFLVDIADVKGITYTHSFSPDSKNTNKDTHHSCLTYEAATLSALIKACLLTFLPFKASFNLALSPSGTYWDANFFLAFFLSCSTFNATGLIV